MAKNLLYAAGHGNLKEAQRFLDKGVDVDTPFNTGLTALSNAAFAGQLEMVRFLLSKGADPNRASELGVTPLRAATRNSRVNVIPCLVEAGADLTHRDGEGQTCTLVAACWSTLETLQTLVEAGASPLDRSPEGHTTLMMAAFNNDQSQERLEYLLEQGVEINAVTEAGASAYSYANEKGHHAVRDYLVSRGAEVNDYISPWRRKKVEE